MSKDAQVVDFDSETQFRKSTELWEILVLFAFQALFIDCGFKNTNVHQRTKQNKKGVVKIIFRD
jgi:hypothetical protein